MGTTTNFGLPYPAGSDSPAGHTQIQALAEATDDAIPIRSAGKSIIATEQSRTNTAFAELGTPDRVSGIVLATGGLLFVSFWAMMKSSVGSAGRAAIFVGAQQSLAHLGIGGPAGVEASAPSTADRYGALVSDAAGLVCNSPTGGPDNPPNSNGQILGLVPGGSANAGGLTVFFNVPAGTYDISVQFRAASGSVTAKERRLWAWSMAFA